ncbi:MAG: hypothetical protein JXR76_01775 [Deltaproteobacteria bacterium]|nr:hypothetical protein [Deltaproteobacteria bacterium]
MKKSIVVLATLIHILVAFNAFAKVDFYGVQLQTTSDGWVNRTTYDEITESPGDIFNFYTYVTGDGIVLTSKALVIKDDSPAPYQSKVWKRCLNCGALNSHEYISRERLVQESYWNTTDFAYENCESANYMSFEYLLNSNSDWITFLFHAVAPCE